MTDSKTESSAPTRRSFLVRIMGVTIGTFFLPRELAGAASDSTANTELMEVTQELDLLAPPHWGRFQSGQPFLLYLTRSGESRIWFSDTEEELAEMWRFYEASCNPGCPVVQFDEVFPIERSSAERQLLDAILADPSADAPRLNYARWLSLAENPLGEYVRTRIQANQLQPADSRYQPTLDRHNELHQQHIKAWFRPLAALGLWPTMYCQFYPTFWMDRGQVNWVQVNIRGVLPEKTKWLFQAAPLLTRLWIGFEDWDIPAIVAQPEMRQIRELRFCKVLNSSVTSDDVRAIASTPNLPVLERLDFSFCKLDEASIAELAASKLFTQLKSLDLQSCGLTASEIDLLARSGGTKQLETFSLENNKLDDGAIEYLAAGTWSSLTTLDLSNNCFGVAGVHALARSAGFGLLKKLSLSHCKLDNEAAANLGLWSSLKTVVTLELGGNRLSAAGLEQLLESLELGHLQSLTLNGNPLGDAGAAYLAGSNRTASITGLDL
jgi:uncharacterized protein (TIGR02996 family)